MRLYKYLLISFICVLISPLISYALTIGPTNIMNNYSPGESTQGTVNVYNEADFPINVWVEFSDWKFKNDDPGKIDFVSAGTTPYSCADWIHIDPMQFELAPKESKKVNYTMTYPPSAKGGYYAAVFFVADPKEVAAQEGEEKKAKMAVTYRVRLAMLVYNEVKGTTRKVTLTSFDVSRPKEKTLSIEYAMKNDGDGYVRSEGKFHIMDDQGKIYASGTLNAAKMQQGESAKGTGEWIGSLPDGEYSVVLTLELKPFGGDVIVKEKRIKVNSSGITAIQ